MLRQSLAFESHADDFASATELDDANDPSDAASWHIVARIAAGMMLTLVAVASVCSVDMVVQANGHLAADSPTILLQAIERSIIRTLPVKPGDIVTKGQVLATLDPTFSQADRLSLLLQQHAAQAVILRIYAELGGTAFRGNPADADSAMQADLFDQRSAQYAAHVRSMDEEVGRMRADLSVTGAQVDLLGHQAAIAREVETIRSALLATQNGSRLNWLDAEAARIRAERDHQEFLGRQTDLQYAIDIKLAERDVYARQWRTALIEDLARNRIELAKIDDNLAKIVKVGDLVDLISPADGVVLEAARLSEGSIAREAEPLVRILPAHTPLMADVRVASADIGYLRAGQKAILKIDALPYQRHGSLVGHLRAVALEPMSVESLSNPQFSVTHDADTFQHAQITVDLPQLAADEGFQALPGMTLTAELKVGSQSVIAYFLSPILEGFSRSFQEAW